MGTRDERVDAYILKSADFARPILTELRDIIHTACPDAQETIKWGAPCFEHHGLMCMLAAFKRHCALAFWKEKLVYGNTPADQKARERIGHIESIAGMPPRKEITAYLKKAMKLNEDGVKSPTRSKDRLPRPEIPIPPDFGAALKKNKKARDAFDSFPPSHRREYLQWITEAKTDATRQRRMETALEWIADGKSRNWKYER